MIDEFGTLIPGACVLNFSTEAAARQAFSEARVRGEVRRVKVERKYIVVE